MRGELIAKIKENKQEAFRLSKIFEARIPEEIDDLERKDGFGWVRKDNNIYKKNTNKNIGLTRILKHLEKEESA